MAGKTSRWRGMLAPIGKPTGDGRMFAPNALTNRDLPLPLRFQRQDGGGHGGAVVVGRILRITYSDDQAYAHGDWLDEKITPEVGEAKEWSRKKVIGPSVDLDDAVMELVPDEHAAEDDCGCDEELAAGEKKPETMLKLVTKGRISGATLVQIPAFAECAALELSDDSDWADDEPEPDPADADAVTAAGFAAGDAVTIDGEDDEPDETAYFVSFSDDGEWAVVVRDDGEVTRFHASRLTRPAEAEAREWEQALLAAATPPAADWFADPKLPGPTALTITDEGRVFGHLASWGVCHIGLPGCTTAPRSRSSYAFFHTGEVLTDDGRTVEVGKITLGTGHADAEAGFRAAADHYDHTGTCVAVVRAGEDDHGIWVAGALTDCDDERRAALRRSPLSGDWRRIGGSLELVAALAVNVPGFPVPRARVAGGQPVSLVAAGSLTTEAREKAAAKGAAMPDGSYPIRDCDELAKATQAIGRAKDPEATKRHIMKRAKALDCPGWEKPESWSAQDTVEAAVRRVMSKRKRFVSYQAELERAAAEVREARIEQLASDLLLLDPDFDEYHLPGAHDQSDHAGGGGGGLRSRVTNLLRGRTREPGDGAGDGGGRTRRGPVMDTPDVDLRSTPSARRRRGDPDQARRDAELEQAVRADAEADIRQVLGRMAKNGDDAVSPEEAEIARAWQKAQRAGDEEAMADLRKRMVRLRMSEVD
jgi:hypothetical protein